MQSHANKQLYRPSKYNLAQFFFRCKSTHPNKRKKSKPFGNYFIHFTKLRLALFDDWMAKASQKSIIRTALNTIRTNPKKKHLTDLKSELERAVASSKQLISYEFVSIRLSLVCRIIVLCFFFLGHAARQNLTRSNAIRINMAYAQFSVRPFEM